MLRSDLFELTPAAPDAAAAAAASATPGDASSSSAAAAPRAGTFGDIMSPTVTGMALPAGFTPLQRLLLSANGNVERLVSSYYNMPVSQRGR